MASFSKHQSLGEYQKAINSIYGVPDDRFFSIYDLVSQLGRFTMRALKGIRKGDREKLKNNLVITPSWMATLSSRVHIDMEESIIRRFPCVCSYCGKKPCTCKKIKLAKRAKAVRACPKTPASLAEFQKMFDEIYPSKERTLSDAGVHLAEETGEVNEAICNYLGAHKAKQFRDIEDEIADWVSCIFGIANSAKIDVATESAKYFKNNCHVCHHAPCTCNFTFINSFNS